MKHLEGLEQEHSSTDGGGAHWCGHRIGVCLEQGSPHIFCKKPHSKYL